MRSIFLIVLLSICTIACNNKKKKSFSDNGYKKSDSSSITKKHTPRGIKLKDVMNAKNLKVGDYVLLPNGKKALIRHICKSKEESNKIMKEEIKKWRKKGHFAYETEEEFQRDSTRRNKVIKKRLEN